MKFPVEPCSQISHQLCPPEGPDAGRARRPPGVSCSAKRCRFRLNSPKQRECFSGRLLKADNVSVGSHSCSIRGSLALASFRMRWVLLLLWSLLASSGGAYDMVAEARSYHQAMPYRRKWKGPKLHIPTEYPHEHGDTRNMQRSARGSLGAVGQRNADTSGYHSEGEFKLWSSALYLLVGFL